MRRSYRVSIADLMVVTVVIAAATSVFAPISHSPGKSLFQRPERAITATVKYHAASARTLDVLWVLSLGMMTSVSPIGLLVVSPILCTRLVLTVSRRPMIERLFIAAYALCVLSYILPAILFAMLAPFFALDSDSMLARHTSHFMEYGTSLAFIIMVVTSAMCLLTSVLFRRTGATLTFSIAAVAVTLTQYSMILGVFLLFDMASST